MTTTKRLIFDIRRKRPGLAKRADRGSALASIRLFCLECMGGSATHTKGCQSYDCPLWRHRFGKRGQKPPENR